jgi:signal transduction histidine kinase
MTRHRWAVTIAVSMTGELEAPMIEWGSVVFGGALLASAVGLRRWPLAALAVMLGGSAVSMVLRPGSPTFALIVVICAAGLEVCYIAATRSRRVSVTGAAMAVAGVLTLLLAVPSVAWLQGGRVGSGGPPFTAIAVPLFIIIAWLIGHSIRQAQARAELVRVQAAAQAAMAERLRIARDVHDIVAHSIGVIAIQAGAGRRVFDASPGEARDALAAIEATSRETLSGLRRMVTGLRRAEPELPEPGPGQAPLDPAPGLADLAGLAGLERLAAMTLDAGVQVEVDWHGTREPLPADIDLSAFRIIQEAVTNVVRHAGTGQCRVSIGQQDGELSIEVTDSGRGAPASKISPSGTGYGITGMRERAELLGGDLSAGPRPGGGFRVAARLPLPAAAR